MSFNHDFSPNGRTSAADAAASAAALRRITKSVAHEDPLASYGIIRIRPMSAVEAACGCRPCIVATPLAVRTDAAGAGQTAQDETYTAPADGSNPSLAHASSTSTSGSGSFTRRARRTMSVFSHAPVLLRSATAAGGAAVASATAANDDDEEDDDDDNPFKLQQRLLGIGNENMNNKNAAGADGSATSAAPLWREEWVDASLAAGAPDAASSDIRYSATIQRSSPSTGAMEAHTFRLTQCLAPERVAVPVVNAPPGTQIAKEEEKKDAQQQQQQQQQGGNGRRNSSGTAAASASAAGGDGGDASTAGAETTNAAPAAIKNQKTAIMYAHPTQQQVFDAFGPSVVQGALRGQRAVVVCYGATGTGKSHTLWGTNNEAGVVPTLLKSLVERFSTDGKEKNNATEGGSGAAASSPSARSGGKNQAQSSAQQQQQSQHQQNEQVLRGRGRLKEVLVSMFDINANEKVTDLLRLRPLEEELATINMASAAASAGSGVSNNTTSSQNINNNGGANNAVTSGGSKKGHAQQINGIVDQLATIGVGQSPDSLAASLEILRAALAIRGTRQGLKHAYGMPQNIDAGAPSGPSAASATTLTSGALARGTDGSAADLQQLSCLETPLDLLEVIANGNPYPLSSQRNPSQTSSAASAAFSSSSQPSVADSSQPALSTAHYESTLTTVVRIEVLVSGGRTTVSAPILAAGGGGSGGGARGAAVTTLSTIEADDLIGRIDIVECAGSEWLTAAPPPPPEALAAQTNPATDADGKTTTVDKGASSASADGKAASSTATSALGRLPLRPNGATSSVMAAAVRGAATESVPKSLLVTPIECLGLPTETAAGHPSQKANVTTEARQQRSAAEVSSSSHVPPPLFASLRCLHRALLLLAATTGNAQQQAAAIADALGGSLLTEYLSPVLSPLPPALAEDGGQNTTAGMRSGSSSSPFKPFDGRLFFIGTISGADSNAQFHNTVDTLRIADGVTRIGTFPTARRDRKLEYAAGLKEQIEKARRELAEIDEINAQRRYGGAAAAAAGGNHTTESSSAAARRYNADGTIAAAANGGSNSNKASGAAAASLPPPRSIVEELDLEDDDDISIDEELLFGPSHNKNSINTNNNTNSSTNNGGKMGGKDAPPAGASSTAAAPQNGGTDAVLAKVAILRELAAATERYQSLTRSLEERARWLQAARQRTHAVMLEKAAEYKAVASEVAIMQTALIAGWPLLAVGDNGGSADSNNSGGGVPSFTNPSTNPSALSSDRFAAALLHGVKRYCDQTLARDTAATAATAPALALALKARRAPLHPSSLLFRLGGLQYQSAMGAVAAGSLAALLAMYQSAYGNGGTGVSAIIPNAALSTGFGFGGSGDVGAGGVAAATTQPRGGGLHRKSSSLHNDPSAGASPHGGGGGFSSAGSVASTSVGGGGNGVQIGAGGRRRNAEAMIAAGNAIAERHQRSASGDRDGRGGASSSAAAKIHPLHGVRPPAALLRGAVPPLVVEALQTLSTGVRCGALAPQVLQAAQKLQIVEFRAAEQRLANYHYQQQHQLYGRGQQQLGLNVTPPVSPRTFANVNRGRAPPVPLAPIALLGYALQPSGAAIAQTPLLVCLNPTTSHGGDGGNSGGVSNNSPATMGGDAAFAGYNGAPQLSDVSPDGSLGGSGAAPFMLSTAGCYISLGQAVSDAAPSGSDNNNNNGGTTSSPSLGSAAANNSSGSGTFAGPQQIVTPVRQPILLPPFFALGDGGTSVGAFATAPSRYSAAAAASLDASSGADMGALADLQRQVLADQQSQYYFSTNANGTSANTLHSRIALPIDAINGGRKVVGAAAVPPSGAAAAAASVVGGVPAGGLATHVPQQTSLSTSVALLCGTDTVVARIDVDSLRQEVRLWPIASRDSVAANIEAANLKLKTAEAYGTAAAAAAKKAATGGSSAAKGSKGTAGGRSVTFGATVGGGGGSTTAAAGGGGVVVPPDVDITVNGIPLKAITVQPSSKKPKAPPKGGGGEKDAASHYSAATPAALDEANFMAKDGYLLRHRDRVVIGNVAFQLILPASWEAVRNGIEAPPLVGPDPDPFLMIAQAATAASAAIEAKRRRQLDKLLAQQQQLQRQAAGDGSGFGGGDSSAVVDKFAAAFTGHQLLVLAQLAKSALAFCGRAARIAPTCPPKMATTTVCTTNRKPGPTEGSRQITTVTEVLGPNEEPTSTKPTPEDSKGEALAAKAGAAARRGSAGDSAVSPPLGPSTSSGTFGSKAAIAAASPSSASSKEALTNGIPTVVTAKLLTAALPRVDNAAKQPVHTVPVPAISMTATRRLVPMLFQKGHNGKAYGAPLNTIVSSSSSSASSPPQGGKDLTPALAAKLFEGKSGEELLMPPGANFKAKPLLTKAQAADPETLPRQVKDHLKVSGDAVGLLETADTKAAFANPGMLLPKATGETKTAIKLNSAGGVETVTVTITTPLPPPPAASFSLGGAGAERDPAVRQARELIKSIRRARGDDAADAFAAQQDQLAAAIAAVAGANTTSPTSPRGGGGGMGGLGAGGGFFSASAIVDSLAALGVSLPAPYSMGTLAHMAHPRQALLLESYERSLIMLLEACWFYENLSNAKAALQAIADVTSLNTSSSAGGNVSGGSIMGGMPPSAMKYPSSSASSKPRQTNVAQSLANTLSNAANFMKFRSFATETVFRLSLLETQLIREFPNEKALAAAAAGAPADRLALFSFEGGDIADPRSLIRHQEILQNKAAEAEKNRVMLSAAVGNGNGGGGAPSAKKKTAARGGGGSDDTDEATGLPRWVGASGGAPPVLSAPDTFELAIAEARRFGDAEMLRRMIEQSELLRRASTIFAFVNPTAKRKRNADGTYDGDEGNDPSAGALLAGRRKGGAALTPENASPEEIVALKQRLFAHLREQEGSAPDTLGDLLDSIEAFMNGRMARHLFSGAELDVLRSATYDDKETLKIATQPPPSEAELFDIAKKALVSPNMDAAQNAEAMRFRIDYELRDFKKKMQAAREWLPNGPSDAFARKEWQRLCLDKHQNPTLQEVRENWEYDEEGGCVRGDCGPLIGPDGQYVTKENRQRAFGSNPHAPSETVGELNPDHESNFEEADASAPTAATTAQKPANAAAGSKGGAAAGASQQLQRKKGGGSQYLAQPPFFEAYFFKLRVRRTMFHRGGGFHLVYGIIRGRFLYYYPECFPHHAALGGAYLFGARIERTAMGVRKHCLRLTLAVPRKESKSTTDPSESELMLCFDTESEMAAWHDQLLKASMPPAGPTLKQYFGESQLSRFVQDSQLVEIVELDRKAEEALQKSRGLFASIGNFSLVGQLSPLVGTIRGAAAAVADGVTGGAFSFNGSAASDPTAASPPGSPRGGAAASASPSPSSPKTKTKGGELVTIASQQQESQANFSAHFSSANLTALQQQLRQGLAQRDPARYRARAIMLALSESLGINPTQSAQISRKPTNLRVGELEGGTFSPNEQRAIALLAADLTVAHYHFGGRKTYTVKGLRVFGSCSPSERLVMPIVPRPLVPAYEKAQQAYAVLASLSAFMADSPKRMSDIGVPSTGIRVPSVHNARDLKKYFKTRIAPASASSALSSTPPPTTQSALKGSKSKSGSATAAAAAAAAAAEAAMSRLWLLDVMGGTIQLIDALGGRAHVYEDRQLVRLERSTADPTLLHMTFYKGGHHMFAEYFPTPANREEFCCLVNTMKPSARSYCPPLAAPPPNAYSMLYTAPGDKQIRAAPFPDPAAESLAIDGEGQVRAAKDPIQKLSVWTGTLNVTGFPIHNPDALERWIPLNEEHDVYCVCLQEVSYRRGEQQLFSYLQRYFEDPNPAINAVIIAPKRYVELTAKEMGDKQWQKEMLEATRDSVTTRHNATVLPQQRRVLKMDSELRRLNYDEEVRNQPRYRLVAKVGLFDMQMAVFARSNHWLACSNIETATYALSPPCYSGERGAVGVAFDLWGTSFCFTGVHLPGLRTPDHDAARRGLFHELFSGLTFANRSINADITNQFDFFFALGDFNCPLRSASRRTITQLHEAQARGALAGFVSENCLLQREMAIDPQAILQEAHDAAEAAANGFLTSTMGGGGGGNNNSSTNLFTLLSNSGSGSKTKDLMFSDEGHLLNSGLILSGFREPLVSFLPTNCIDIATGKFNIAKVVGPNYPDRILVKAPVYCPPVLDEEGYIEKLIELEDGAEEAEEEEEEENEDEKMNKLITLDGEEAADEEGEEAEEVEELEEIEEEEEEVEGDDEDDIFLGTEASKGKKAGKTEDAAAAAAEAQAAAAAATTAQKPQTEDIGASLYPIHCVRYGSSTQLRISEHFPVSANFICNVPRPIGFVFMKNVRRAVITIADLRVTGIVFPFAKQAVFSGTAPPAKDGAAAALENISGGSVYGETASPPASPRRVRIEEPGGGGAANASFVAAANSSSTRRYRPLEDAQPAAIAAAISVNNHYLDPPMVVASTTYDITRFSSTLQDARSAASAPPCKFSAAFAPSIGLEMGIPTTPEHLMHATIAFSVYDQNDPDAARGRRGAARIGLMNFAGPVDAHVQSTLKSESVWELLEVPFRCPLEIAGNRMGCVSGSMMVTYERIGDDEDDA